MPEDTSPTESAMLEPDSPNNAGGENPDKQGGALVIPSKAPVGEKMINPIQESIKRRARTNPVGRKRRAPPGTAKKRMAGIAETHKRQKRTAKSLKIILG